MFGDVAGHPVSVGGGEGTDLQDEERFRSRVDSDSHP
jgi:hypothetical protein